MAGLGLLGLQWSGVTTTLRCLCGTSIAADAGQGIADVHDPRLGELARVSKSKRMVAATLEVSDLTRLVRGARRGEELGGELLAHMRTTDAVVLVVRCFHDDQVAHPSGTVNPLDDAETIELELVFADQAAVARRLERVAKTAKSGDRAIVAEQELLLELAAGLEQGRPARSLGLDLPDALDLLTAKPALTIANVDQSGNEQRWRSCGRSERSAGSTRSRLTPSSRPRSRSWTRATGGRSWTTSASSGRRSRR